MRSGLALRLLASEEMEDLPPHEPSDLARTVETEALDLRLRLWLLLWFTSVF